MNHHPDSKPVFPLAVDKSYAYAEDVRNVGVPGRALSGWRDDEKPAGLLALAWFRPPRVLQEELVNQVVSGSMDAQARAVVDVDAPRVQIVGPNAKVELAGRRIFTRHPVNASSTHQPRTIVAPVFEHPPGTGTAEDFGSAVERDKRRVAPDRRRQQLNETFEYVAS
jgi:hypothetical protein